MAQAQQSGHPTSVCYRPAVEKKPQADCRTRKTSNAPGTFKTPFCCSQKREPSLAIFCNMVSYQRLHRWQLLLPPLIIRATPP